MTKQITHVSKGTVEPNKRVLIQHREVVTGSPQAIIYLHADFREVEPRHGSKTLAERVNEAYGGGLEPEEKELLDRAAKQLGSRLSNEE